MRISAAVRLFLPASMVRLHLKVRPKPDRSRTCGHEMMDETDWERCDVPPDLSSG
jgi:hypothetical protein